jgi:hypothetical protein
MFKAIFGVLGLLITLAVVSSLAKTQFGAIGQMLGGQTTTRVHSSSNNSGSSTDSSAGSVTGRAVGGARLDGFAATAGAEMPSAQQQIQGVQQSVRDRTATSLQQGVQRNQRAQP